MVDSLSIVNGSGNPIPGADIISGSGTSYNDIAETPEPATIGLFGLGLLGLIALRKKAVA
jgi:PEP-CTERM motif